MYTFARISVPIAILFTLTAPHPAKAEDNGSVDRGKYIVEGVAMCGRCHTPYNLNGEADHKNWLMGGPLQIQPTYSVPNWALVTPRIARRPPGSDSEFVKLLTTGISRTGAPPKPPMPSFRMTRSDAESVLAYLKSLNP